MSGTYVKGETKTGAGVYRRQESNTGGTIASAMNGVFCIPVQADFGPVGEARKITSKKELEAIYMSSGTVDAAGKLFDMGALTVYVYRVGTGGKKGTLAIKNTESSTVVNLETKYETSLPFTITLKQRLGDTTAKECSVYNGTTLLEKITFTAGDDEIANFVEALLDSNYISATKTTGATGTLQTVTQAAFTGGNAPIVANDDYSNAFSSFEPLRWNVLVLDTLNSSVKAIAKSFMERIHEAGSTGICVLGEDTDSSLKTRMENAKSYNAPYIVYCGSGYYDVSGSKIDGYLSVAVQAGIIGCKDSSKSIVHTEIPDAESCIENLTESQYVEAIKSGLLLLSEGADGQVWFDSGINTYVNLDENDDEGWKKIKRTAVRYEAFDRIDRTLEPLIGKINCDSDGIDNVIQQAKLVLADMARESKILDDYEFYEDTENPHAADYAYFIIKLNDVDSLEKIYLTYQFQYTA